MGMLTLIYNCVLISSVLLAIFGTTAAVLRLGMIAKLAKTRKRLCKTPQG